MATQNSMQIEPAPLPPPLPLPPLAPLAPLPPLPPSLEAPWPPSWLHKNLRSVIALAMTATVCFLALRGESEAIAALVATFAVLAGALWGERSALKRPNVDA